MKMIISLRSLCIRLAVLGALIVSFHLVGSAITIVSTIPVGAGPTAIAVSPNRHRAYVANRDSANTTFGVGVYSTETGAAFGSIPVPAVHKSFLLSADDRVGYLGVNEPDGLNVRTLVLDVTTIAGASPVPVLGEIHETCLTLFNQNASTGWGFNSTNNTISLVHVGRLEIRANIAVSPTPQALALSVQGKRLYVACDLSNEVRVFAASNGQHVETLSVSGRPTDIVVLPDGMTAYVAQLDTNSIAVLSL